MKDKLKKIFSSFDPKALQLLKIMLIMVIIMFLISGSVFLLGKIRNKGSKSSNTYKSIEKEIVDASLKYVKKYPDKKPQVMGNKITVSYSELEQAGFLKPLNEYTKESCTASLNILKTKAGYHYQPHLICGTNYETKTLPRVLISKVISEKDSMKAGLYSYESAKKDSYINLGTQEGYNLNSNPLLGGYYFRGDRVKNFLKINKKIYRIIGIDKDNDLIIIAVDSLETIEYDYRYNKKENEYWGINDYNLSYIKEYLDKDYEVEAKKMSVISKYLIPKNICIGSRFRHENGSDGKFECSKVLMNESYSLLPTYYYMIASLDKDCFNFKSPNCYNYNYLSAFSGWTGTPVPGNTYLVYKISDGYIVADKCNNRNNLYPVYYLTGDVSYISGTGEKDDPYLIE